MNSKSKQKLSNKIWKKIGIIGTIIVICVGVYFINEARLNYNFYRQMYDPMIDDKIIGLKRKKVYYNRQKSFLGKPTSKYIFKIYELNSDNSITKYVNLANKYGWSCNSNNEEDSVCQKQSRRMNIYLKEKTLNIDLWN